MDKGLAPVEIEFTQTSRPDKFTTSVLSLSNDDGFIDMVYDPGDETVSFRFEKYGGNGPLSFTVGKEQIDDYIRLMFPYRAPKPTPPPDWGRIMAWPVGSPDNKHFDPTITFDPGA